MQIRIDGKELVSRVVLDDYFALVVQLGDERPPHLHYEFGRANEDLIDLATSPVTGKISKITVTCCSHYQFENDPIFIPNSETGSVAISADKRTECEALSLALYSDGIVIRITQKLVMHYIKTGNVLFGIAADDELAEIRITCLTAAEVSHAKAVMLGEGFAEVWQPEEQICSE